VKEFLSHHEIHFTEFNVQDSEGAAARLEEKVGRVAVPYIVVETERDLGLKKDRRTFLGFEMNRGEIERALRLR